MAFAILGMGIRSTTTGRSRRRKFAANGGRKERRDVADKNETVAEILREMREMPKDWIVDANANFVFVKYADRFEAAHRREVAELRKQTRNCDGDRTDWRWYWGRYVTTQVCPCKRKTVTPEKHLRYFLNWLFLPKLVTGNDRDGEGSAR